MIRLAPMTAPEFEAYVDASARAFAIESPRLRHLAEKEALAASYEELRELLPTGIATTGQLLWSIFDKDALVGYLHLGVDKSDPASMFVWDLEIAAAHRRRGYARAALTLAMAHVKGLGIRRLGLNVFAENSAAMALYTSMGFGVTQSQMALEL
ncbi:MAG: GNAT family N-acetyltransferase [Myxococcales bacterium]|nr:GNAT family N-acetyltransferase [Myxococcales bacterium]